MSLPGRGAARGRETQEEMKTQRAGVVEVDRSLRRRRRTCEQREGQERRKDQPVRKAGQARGLEHPD